MRKNILVSGSHRSGTTWTGNVIATAKGLRYIHEPFNIGFERKNNPLTYWFEHLTADSPLAYQDKVKRYLNSFNEVIHTDNLKTTPKVRSLKDIIRLFTSIRKRLTNRTIIKDPIAIMSAEWLYENFDWEVVILIRHPAAFVASLKVKDWQFDFNNYLQQPHLMETYLKNYSEQIREYSNEKKDIIKQGILLWNTIHETILYYKEKYNSKWYFVKHEDLSVNSVPEFKKMFSFLQLPFDETVKQYIIESTTSKDSSELKRNAKDNVKSWKKRLSAEEIHEIKESTKNIWSKFYSEEDW